MSSPETHSILHSDRLSRDFVAVGVEDTVSQALEKIRAAPGTSDIFYCYACDAEGRLMGVVPVRKLIRAAPEEKIAALMFKQVVKLPLDAPDSLVEDFFVTYRFLAFPVVDAGGRIVGVVEVNQFVDAYSDTLFDEFEGRVRDEVFRLVGVPQDELKLTNPVRMSLKRFPWLLVNIAGGFIAANIARMFEATVARLVVVTAFIPMVLVLSESLGVQTTVVSTAMMSKGRFDRSAIRREVLVTGLVGLMAALVVSVLARVLYPGIRFPLALFAAVASSTLFAALLGLALPPLFRRLEVDPHLASAPLVLATADNVTLLIYLTSVALLVP